MENFFPGNGSLFVVIRRYFFYIKNHIYHGFKVRFDFDDRYGQAFCRQKMDWFDDQQKRGSLWAPNVREVEIANGL